MNWVELIQALALVLVMLSVWLINVSISQSVSSSIEKSSTPHNFMAQNGTMAITWMF